MIRLTEEQRAYIQMNLGVKSVSNIAKDLNIGYMNVYREAKKLGIPRRTQLKFTKEIDEFIVDNYGLMRAGELAKRINVDKRAIYNRVRALGCTRKSK